MFDMYLSLLVARPPKPAIEELTDPNGKYIKQVVEVREREREREGGGGGGGGGG